MTDMIAERARKIGGTTIRSISDIAGRQRILDNNAAYVDPKDMVERQQGSCGGCCAFVQPPGQARPTHRRECGSGPRRVMVAPRLNRHGAAVPPLLAGASRVPG
ncbi:hypothetical protein [Sphingopyxis sp.]|uniref:hypothetical protein n=1 Tax=Sphingopyxis sp. TaxID=1908224 RepID=UPI00311FE1B3